MRAPREAQNLLSGKSGGKSATEHGIRSDQVSSALIRFNSSLDLNILWIVATQRAEEHLLVDL